MVVRIKNSMIEKPILWRNIGGIALFIIFLLVIMNWGFSIWYLFLFLFLVAIDATVFKTRFVSAFMENKIEEAVDDNVRELMIEIKNRCNEILDQEINRITEPIIKNVREDFAKSLNWLWEDGDIYLSRVDMGINETHAVIQMIGTLSDDSMKIEQKLNKELDILIEVVDIVRSGKEKDNESLEKCLGDKAEELKEGIEGEKEVFFDYAQKMLSQQIKSNQDGLDMANYFDASQLAGQFSLVIEKSVEARISYFEESIIHNLEEMSADIVGRMQSGALRIMNVFKNIEDLIDKLVDEYQGDNTVALRRLSDSRQKIVQMKEQANEIMVTLAWQDILVEKRWQEIQEKMYIIKDKVMKNVSEDVIEYLQNSLDDEIVGYRVMADTTENALIYKAILDAEVIYQVFIGENLLDIIGDGVNVLFQFMRPVELMVLREIRSNDTLLKKRRYIKDQIKHDEYQGVWDKLINIMRNKNADLPHYLHELFPMGLASFCNNPYIHQKPENLNQAAWMLFLLIIENSGVDDEIFFLTGMLLIMYKLRNKYIHPLKSLPLPLNNQEEIKHIRYCTLQSVEILMSLDMKSLLRAGRR